ncbi:PDZ domain-containing protein [Treponema phagedenis]|uniref:Trypsin n=1 Tax=Treponema phagedenis TaxID=162 RepID=A0A0B7GW20_TREPH|nr:trypsin-like peptidase domain-containing protein [Treponema phagedenis]EFW37195.1 trypsin [Treponema phagedenis F0421]NVP22677.1 trypsin-like peptidase domain-containing protein [Treponema phagedenis]QEJ94804.1 trypsin-like serine protease [Treponema phagedenis]QEJ98421.1 trypsin-like serine protease [Treponema phagedenis]QEK00708.1 trypsin-like serine protease [Treponema phagedenis]
MKLYSRIQVVFIVAVAAIVVGGGALFFGYHLSQKQNAHSMPAAETSDIPIIAVAPAGESLQPYPVADKTKYTVNEQENISVYEQTNEAVVNITTEIMGINWILEPVPLEGGSGSGSIIDPRGYVLTNTHVIEDASKIYISLHDGSQYKASIIGIDKENDLAVLKFTPPKNVPLTVIQFGESDGLKVGQKVLAIGNPFGLTRTLTVGIVSALGRPIQNEKNIVIKNMIQTDTAINPGNSGGPLLDTQGRMIGINTMIYSTSGSSAGVGFAVPVNTAKRVVADIIKYGKVRRGSIDAELVQLNASIANYASLPTDKGLLVSKVKSGSYADRAGLRAGTSPVRYGLGRRAAIIYLGGDIIVSIAGQPINGLSDYYSVLEDKKPHEEITVTVLRGNKKVNLTMTLSERTE